MPDFAVVDVETSGFQPPNAEVVEIAVVHVDEAGRLTGRWDTLVRPLGGVGATHVHGITPGMVRQAPSFHDIAETLHTLLAGRVPVAHNLAFDAKFLIAEFTRAGINAPEIREGVCTLNTAKRHIPGPPHKLANCCAHAGITLTDAHKALGDATATAHLLGYFLRHGLAPTGTAVRTRPPVPMPRPPLERLFRPRAG